MRKKKRKIIPDRSMERALNNLRPHGLDNDRRYGEPWPKRWLRLFGREPNMVERRKMANNCHCHTIKDFKRNK
jgi:hypothetical protein